MKESKIRLDSRNKFIAVRVMRHWNRLPRKDVNAPVLAVFKARLDRALRNLGIARGVSANCTRC